MKRRKTDRAKQIDHHCRNHGECPHCTGNRTHQAERAKPADEKEQLESVIEQQTKGEQ